LYYMQDGTIVWYIVVPIYRLYSEPAVVRRWFGTAAFLAKAQQ